MVFSLYEMSFVLYKMLYHVSLLGVLVTLMLFSLSIKNTFHCCYKYMNIILYLHLCWQIYVTVV